MHIIELYAFDDKLWIFNEMILVVIHSKITYFHTG